MKEKRAFRRNDAGSAPGTLVVGETRFDVVFDNLSLIGARVRAEGKPLPPVGSIATLTMNEEDLRFFVRCKVVGLDNGEYYRLKFDGIGEGSLNNLMAILRKLSGGSYAPESELPNLVLDLG
jgi:hypothetical protein